MTPASGQKEALGAGVGSGLENSALDSPGAQLLVRRGVQASAYTRGMGTRLRRFEPGRVETELDLREDMTRHHGQAHGAVLADLADTVSAWAASSVMGDGVAGDVVTAEYKINFLTAARGETLWARGEALRAGKRRVIVRADVYAHTGGADLHVATALATVAPPGSPLGKEG